MQSMMQMINQLYIAMKDQKHASQQNTQTIIDKQKDLIDQNNTVQYIDEATYEIKNQIT